MTARYWTAQFEWAAHVRLAQNAGICLHIENLYGENSHHIVETCFKGTARALRHAVEIDERLAGSVPSTKNVLIDTH